MARTPTGYTLQEQTLKREEKLSTCGAMYDADKGKNKNHVGVSWHTLPQSAEMVAMPMRQVAQSVEAFPGDAALNAWKQQPSAMLSLTTAETTDSSTSQSLPLGRTSIPAS